MYTTIITPIYKGEKYIPALLKNIESIAKKVPTLNVEWILVNDYPARTLPKINTEVLNLSIIVLENESNLGIQGARVEGVKYANGKYIIFLDQDDILSEDTLSIYSKSGDYDIYLANGYQQKANDTKRVLFRSKWQQQKAGDLKYYFYIGNLIASPGMTMVKKDIIPKCWLDNLLDMNGADDWLLWSSLLENKPKIKFVFQPLYVHSANPESVSNNNSAMIDSSLEALQIFENNFPIENRLCKIHKQRLEMRKKNEVEGFNKYWMYMLHPLIAMTLIKYKILGIC